MRTMDPRKSSPTPQLTIKADDDVAKGRFANLAQVASAHDVFVYYDGEGL